MDGNKRLKLSAARLKNLRRSKRLFELTAEKIAINITLFAAEESKKQQLIKLPKCLRQTVLRFLTDLKCLHPYENTEHFDLVLKGLTLLLESQPKQLTLNGLLTFCPENTKLQGLGRVLRLVATHAPEIESLAVNEINNQYESDPNYLLDKTIVDDISSLSKLRKLILDNTQCSIKYSDLKNILRKLSDLYYLDARIDIDCTEDEISNDFKRCFSHLKVFLFETKNYYASQKLTQLCLRHLPELEFTNQYLDYKSIPDEHFDSPSRLRHIATTPGFKPLHKKFPNVTHLKIYLKRPSYDEEKINALLQFRKIKHLHLETITFHLPSFDRIIKNYGINLQTLIINDIWADIRFSFEDIFRSCPNLETLSVLKVDISDHSTPLGNIPQKLKDLTWAPSENERVCVSNILTAPRLESFCMIGKHFDLQDMKQLSLLLGEKRILRELTSFRAMGQYDAENNEEVEFIRAVIDALLSASAFLPKLVKIQFIHLLMGRRSSDEEESVMAEAADAFDRCVKQDKYLKELVLQYFEHDASLIRLPQVEAKQKTDKQMLEHSFASIKSLLSVLFFILCSILMYALFMNHQ